MSPPSSSGSRLRYLVRRRRLELHWTQRQAAEAAGVSLATWQALEREEHSGSFKDLTLARVASALKLRHDEIFSAAGQPWAGTVTADEEPVVADLPVDELLKDLTQTLRALWDRSEEDFMILYRFAKEFADHLRRRDERP